MRTLPEAMQAAFTDQQGINLHFVIAINWQGEDEIWYSECELGDDIYAYVKEFSNFQSVSHVEGLGSVSSIEVSFYDQFGHFKEKIDTVDFFNSTTATLYLTLDGSEFFDLFEGKITDGATWSNNIFHIELISNTIDKEVGYQPTIDDVDESDPNYSSLERRFNTSGVWPSIFGTVQHYEAPIIKRQRQANTTADVDYEAAVPPTYYSLPVDSTDDFDLDTDYMVNIVGKEQEAFSILGTGQFKTGNIFQLNKSGVTSVWYQNIAFSSLEYVGISGETDAPKTRIEIDPGEVVLTSETLDTLGPDGEATSAVWLQYMKLRIQYTVITGTSIIINSRYVNCVKQEGNICYLNEKLVFPHGATDIYIKEVFKANDMIYKIPSGSTIYILGDLSVYAIDTKAGTTVDFVGFKNGEKLEEIDSSVYTVGSAALWTGDCPPLTYIYLNAEIYMRYLEHFAIQDKQNETLIVSAHNNYDTDAEVIASMSGLTVNDDNPLDVSFAYTDVEQAANVIPEVAWQGNKAIRFSRQDNEDILEAIDLTNPGSVLHTFSNLNVLRESVTYGFTSKDNLYTIFKADFQTNDLLKKLETLQYKKNHDKYGKEILKTEYYIFPDKADAETSLQWWRDKLSQYYYTVSLTGFMDAFHLEVWDRVAIDISDISFYDPSSGTPFTNTHTATPLAWVASGRVKSISPNLKEGIIDFVIELDSISGDTPDKGFITLG